MFSSDNKYNLKSIVIAFGFFWTFASGVLITKLFLAPPETEIVYTERQVAEPIQEEYRIVAIVPEEPLQILVVEYVDRIHSVHGSVKGIANHIVYDSNSGKVSKWETTKIYESSFKLNELDLDNNFVNSIEVDIPFDNYDVTLDVPVIYTPMVVRSEKSFTKFFGSTTSKSATLSKGLNKYKAYASFSKGFNNQDQEINIKGLGVHTDWLGFWDKDGNFYHLDKTIVEQEHPVYKSHSFFAKLVADSLIGTPSYYDNFNVSADISSISVESGLDTYKFTIGPSFYSDYEKLYKTNLITGNDGLLGIYLRIN